MKEYCVYIITNKPRGTIYIGVTNCLQRRISEHKEGLSEGFSKQYNLNKLVFYESFNNISDALSLEKRLKNWHRDWKINLIEKANPSWEDLYEKYFKLVDPETSSGWQQSKFY